MQLEIKTWLQDVLTAIQEIESYFSQDSSFEVFSEDLRTRRAVERNIEIMGEAINRILKKDPFIDLSNAKKVVQTRNHIAHSYDDISEEILWSIVIKHLPSLKKDIERLLQL